MIHSIDHVNLVVADLDRSVAFYTGVLGLRKTQDVTMEGAWIEEIVRLPGVKGRVAFVEAPDGRVRIELLQYVAPAGLAIPAQRLRAANVTLLSDPVKVPAGVVRFASGDKRLLYFLDPDGVLLELAEYGEAAPAPTVR